jgi:hypothetical protein
MCNVSLIGWLQTSLFYTGRAESRRDNLCAAHQIPGKINPQPGRGRLNEQAENAIIIIILAMSAGGTAPSMQRQR